MTGTTDGKPDTSFCPFCYRKFEGDVDTCPVCGQNLKPYKNDLAPWLRKIQDYTNIDMKSTKAKAIGAAVVFMVVFIAALAVVNYIDNMEDPPEPSGIIIDIHNSGYMDLTDDFATGGLKALPLYESPLKLKISIGDRSNDYVKIVWSLRTDSYNPSNVKDPFTLKVTKERSKDASFDSVTWDTVSVGKFSVVANCYLSDGTTDVLSGDGTYFGKLVRTYSWEYNGVRNSFEYSLSSDLVERALRTDLTERLDMQKISGYTDFVRDDGYISDLNGKLRSVYNRNCSDGWIYPEFVLSFVRSCFPEMPDVMTYKTSDYWAYPSELILKGCGDDEDKSILYASLMAIDGFQAGIIDLDGRTMAMIDNRKGLLPYTVPMVRNVYTDYLVIDVSSDSKIGFLGDGYAVQYGRNFYHYSEDITSKTVLEFL